MSAKSKISIAVVVVTAFLAGVFFTTMGSNLFGRAGDALSRSYAGDTEVQAAASASPADIQDAFMEVSAAVNPTVVQVRSERVQQQRNPFQGTPFEDFFGGPGGPGGERRAQGLGSGVIVQSDGYIVTNNHVVEGAEELEVHLFDGTVYQAELVGTDEYSDLAVIRVDADGLPAVSFGNSDDLRTGQWVLAFGSPLSEDLSNSVTAGIISAIGRLQGGQSFRRGPQQPGNGQQNVTGVHNFIQTDAAINPGNSGGPLINLQGQLIGINTAIVSQSGGYQGIGFAIPVNTVRNVAEQLIETGTVRRGRLGVSFNDASPSVKDALDLPRGAAQVADVVSGSAAEEAGIQPGDFIVAINGEELTNSLQLSQMIGRMNPGEEVEITINRNGDEQTVTATLGEAAGSQPTASGDTDGSPSGSASEQQMMEELGFAVTDLTAQMRRRLGISTDIEGVVVTQVDPASEAVREARLGRGAIIVGANREPVNSVEDFRRIYNEAEPGDYVLLSIRVPSQGGNLQSTTTAIRKPAD